MDEEARLQRLRADRGTDVESGDGRRDVAARYQEYVDVARREEKTIDKLIAELIKRREQIEQRMRDA